MMNSQSTPPSESIPTIEKAWFEWLIHNIERGCASQDLLTLLLENHVPWQQAQVALSQAKHAVEHRKNPGWTASSQAFLPSTLPNDTLIDLGDVKVRLLMRLKRPDIAFFENVLSDTECDQLIDVARQKLQPAQVYDEARGMSIESMTRTASAASIERNTLPLESRIEARLSKLLHWPSDNLSGLEVVQYQVGHQFSPHYDYLSAQTLAAGVHKKRRQRMATVVFYLNDVESGGETNFPYVGLSIAPKKGSALVFAYVDDRTGEPDTLSLHCSLPVIAGEKWIGVKILLQQVEN